MGGADWTFCKDKRADPCGCVVGGENVANFVTCIARRITVVNLASNNCRGTLPESFGALAMLTKLRLPENSQMRGTLPESWASLASLNTLAFYSCSVIGTLPDSYSALRELRSLVASHNQLGGTLPSTWGSAMAEIRYFQLHNNQLEGTLPATLGSMTRITHLALAQNKFTGTLPASLANLVHLEELRLDRNGLTGTLPASFAAALTLLKTIALEENELSGEIPKAWGAMGDAIQIRLGENRLSGLIPPELATGTATLVELHTNRFRCPIPAGLPGVGAGNSYTDADGKNVHTLACCPGGKFNAPPSDTCEVCPANNTAMALMAGNKADCFVCNCSAAPCAAGRYAVLRDSAAAAAANASALLGGSGSSGGAAAAAAEEEEQKEACAKCPRGQYQDQPGAVGANSCLSCHAATAGARPDSAPGSSLLADCILILRLPCESGASAAHSLAGVCEPCPAGRFKNGSNTAGCEACPCGTWQDRPGQGACDAACAAGTYGNATTGRCDACPVAGFFCLGSQRRPVSEAKLCVPGQHVLHPPNATSDRTCAPCAAGRFSTLENAAVCGECPAGSFQPAGGKGFCLPHSVCAKGERAGSVPVATADRSCLPCAAGTISVATNAAACVACPGNEFQPEAGQASCTKHASCSKGERVAQEPNATADRGCVPCEVGRFGTLSNAQGCGECPLGKHQSIGGQTSCDACAAGQSGKADAVLPRTSAASHCEACPASAYSDAAGSSDCSACADCAAAGAARSGCGGASAGVCIPCGVGTFKASSGSCEPCAAGSFQNATGQAQCIACSSVACPNGAHRKGCGGASMGYCGTCSPGTFINGRACLPCAAGRFSAVENAAGCDACAADTFQPQARRGFCLRHAVCAAGEHETAAPTATSDRVCAPCAAGRFASTRGLRTCLPCMASSFQPDAGRGFCLPHTVCTKGEYVASLPSPTNDRQCAPCDAQHFSNSTNMGACARCPAGKFQDSAASAFCDSCSEGFFCNVSAATGLTEKAQCPAGFSCSGARVDRCELKISDVGTGKCVSCPDRSFADITSNVCMLCPRERGNSSSELHEGVSCAKGDVRVEDDFFVVGTEEHGGALLGAETQIIKCRTTGVCKTSVAGGAGGMLARTACHQNTAGVLCGTCAPGYGFVGVSCVACAENNSLAKVLLAAASLVFCVMYWSSVKTAMRYAKRRSKSKYVTMTTLKILMAFLYKTSLLSNYRLDWGSSVRYIFSGGGAAASGDPTSAVQAACLGWNLHVKMKFIAALPLLAAALPLPPIAIARLRGKKNLWGAPVCDTYCAAVLIAWWLIHPAVTRESTMALLTVPVGSAHFVTSDLSIDASSPEYAFTRRLAVGLLASFVPAVPLLVFGFMYARRDLLAKASDDEGVLQGGTSDDLTMARFVRNTTFYFYGSYKHDMYLWELVSFCSKTSLVFVACLASVSVDSAELSKTIFFATWIALLAFVLEFKYEPYERPVEGRLLKLTEATMLALLLLAQGLNIRGGGGGGGGGGGSSDAETNDSFRGSLRLVAASLMVAMLAYFINVFACQQREKSAMARRDRAVRRQAKSDAEARVERQRNLTMARERQATMQRTNSGGGSSRDGRAQTLSDAMASGRFGGMAAAAAATEGGKGAGGGTGGPSDASGDERDRSGSSFEDASFLDSSGFTMHNPMLSPQMSFKVRSGEIGAHVAAGAAARLLKGLNEDSSASAGAVNGAGTSRPNPFANGPNALVISGALRGQSEHHL
jgi:hypothetical protein